MDAMTPREIVRKLDEHIVGQDAAKRAVAVAIRNRWRRQQLPEDVAAEVSPKNIVMIGPTGVGKTEIARRIANLTAAPFIKIEATKFTEVGYHGRDVESMIRDLVEQAVNLVRAEHAEKVETDAAEAVEDRLLDLLYPPPDEHSTSGGGYVGPDDAAERREQTRQGLRQRLRDGLLDEQEVEITTTQKAVPVAMFSNMGLDQMDPDMGKMFENLIPDQSKRRRVSVPEARRILMAEEVDRLIDREKIASEAIHRTEQAGIVFLDEIDKVAVASEGGGKGPDVSRQGVQRDLLPIVEGTAVTTRHGVVNTDHILFVAAGAFHSSSVSDLMPELQGRFPIRVELSALTRDDFVRILTEPSSALTVQQQALLSTEGLEVAFDEDAIEAMADLAAKVNSTHENIGARRLMTIMERVFEEISFNAPQRVADGQTKLTITAELVHERLAEVVADEDLSKFVL